MEIIYIILGWLFGIISPGIVEYIGSHRKKKFLNKLLKEDLLELKKRLCLYPILIYPKYGKLNSEYFNWIKNQTKDFKDLEGNIDFNTELEKEINISGRLEIFLEKYNKRNKKENPGFSFKKNSTITLDSNLVNIGLLDNIVLEKLLELRFHIHALNEEIESVNEYGKMTFDSNISNENHIILKNNIDNINLLIAEKSMFIVDKINVIVIQLS